jgi:UDP-N-acetylmuramate: L-alanyl-gamma-D-glutamyl-meso-diaminopimelate ligase
MYSQLLKTIKISSVKLVDMTPKGGTFIYCKSDPHVKELGEKCTLDGVSLIPYQAHSYEIEAGKTYLKTSEEKIPVSIIGEHNLQNLQGALEVCKSLGLEESRFLSGNSNLQGSCQKTGNPGNVRVTLFCLGTLPMHHPN